MKLTQMVANKNRMNGNDGLALLLGGYVVVFLVALLVIGLI